MSWEPWGPCSVTCGMGTKSRTRQCKGGTDCQGTPSETTPCDTGECPTWTPWEPWSPCSVTCGMGKRSRTRACKGGHDCKGETSQEESCDKGSCPHWASWGKREVIIAFFYLKNSLQAHGDHVQSPAAKDHKVVIGNACTDQIAPAIVTNRRNAPPDPASNGALGAAGPRARLLAGLVPDSGRDPALSRALARSIAIRAISHSPAAGTRAQLRNKCTTISLQQVLMDICLQRDDHLGLVMASEVRGLARPADSALDRVNLQNLVTLAHVRNGHLGSPGVLVQV